MGSYYDNFTIDCKLGDMPIFAYQQGVYLPIAVKIGDSISLVIQ